MPQRNLLLLFLAVVVSYLCYVRNEHDPYCRYVANGLAAIQQSALDPATSKDLFAGAMDGMVGVLRKHGDQHSQFLSEAKAGPLRDEIHQQFGGIGVRLRFAGEPPVPVVAGPIRPDTPASKAKIVVGDQIRKIDGAPTAGMNASEVIARLTGVLGTAVELTLQRRGESNERTVVLERALIPVDSILGDRRGNDGSWLFPLEVDPRVAHVRIVAFGDRTAQEFAAIIPQILEQGVRGIVLDLRDNAGGSLSSAVAICEMLLPAGKTIVETRGREQVLHERYATKVNGVHRELPLAIIINQNSASAAEIVAACLQDHGRAVVVGQRSFGKGTVQQLLPLGKGLLKLTWASFWRPSGANVDRRQNAATTATWGVQPDMGFECELTPVEYSVYQDHQNLRDDNDLTDSKSGEKGLSERKTAAAKFVDRTLGLAQRYLESKFSEKAENN
jgi:carboxyl-terminal processing protease